MTIAGVMAGGQRDESVASAWKSEQVTTGWRGYFTGSDEHITKVERAARIARWFVHRQQRLSANGRSWSPSDGRCFPLFPIAENCSAMVGPDASSVSEYARAALSVRNKW